MGWRVCVYVGWGRMGGKERYQFEGKTSTGKEVPKEPGHGEPAIERIKDPKAQRCSDKGQGHMAS